MWSLARLLEFDTQAEYEPELTLSNHRGAITSLVVGQSTNPETSICVSASKDKTCIVWNYQTGHVLRTLLFPSVPLCASLDPCARGLFVASEDGALYLVEFFGDSPLLGSRSAELASIVVQVKSPLGVADAEMGPPSCLAVSYDGTSILTGHAKGKILQWNLTENSHPTELANLNASVTNILFVPPIPAQKGTKPASIVKPNQNLQRYAFTSQLEGDLGSQTRLSQMLNTQGFSTRTIEEAIAAFDGPSSEDHLDQQLWSIMKDQKALHADFLHQDKTTSPELA